MFRVTTSVKIQVEGRPDLTDFTAFCTVVDDVPLSQLPYLLNAYENYLKDMDKHCSEKFMEICNVKKKGI